MFVGILLVQAFHICIYARSKGTYCIRNAGRKRTDKVTQAKERASIPFRRLLAEQREN
jgi:hypothetical protein